MIKEQDCCFLCYAKYKQAVLKVQRVYDVTEQDKETLQKLFRLDKSVKYKRISCYEDIVQAVLDEDEYILTTTDTERIQCLNPDCLHYYPWQLDSKWLPMQKQKAIDMKTPN